MISAPRVIATLTAAGLAAAIALTPTSSSDASKVPSHKRPDTSAQAGNSKGRKGQRLAPKVASAATRSAA